MTAERCSECGFDGGAWSDAEAIAKVAELPELWAQAIRRIPPEDLLRRPIADMWSIAEYTDHVRETTFGMRFLLDIALNGPGTDLGHPPEAPFDPVPLAIEVPSSLDVFGEEVRQLVTELDSISVDRWSSAVVISGEQVDIHWIVRHEIHDVTHHLRDVDRLRTALG